MRRKTEDYIERNFFYIKYDDIGRVDLQQKNIFGTF
jgi:hypothetical protein